MPRRMFDTFHARLASQSTPHHLTLVHFMPDGRLSRSEAFVSLYASPALGPLSFPSIYEHGRNLLFPDP